MKSFPVVLTLLLAFLVGACIQQNNSPTYFADEESDEVWNEDPSAVAFELFQNQPEPFNTATMIQFRLPETSYVALKVNLADGEVDLFRGILPGPATHHHLFEAPENLPSGQYNYSLTVVDRFLVKKMTFEKP